MRCGWQVSAISLRGGGGGIVATTFGKLMPLFPGYAMVVAASHTCTAIVRVGTEIKSGGHS